MFKFNFETHFHVLPWVCEICTALNNTLNRVGGRISKNVSSRVKISLDEKAMEAFEKIKNSLVSQDVLLHYSNYEKDFDLTTDASQYALSAVLSQKGRLITFLSRTFSEIEEQYANNEKEMLEIILALKFLRNFQKNSDPHRSPAIDLSSQ